MKKIEAFKRMILMAMSLIRAIAKESHLR